MFWKEGYDVTFLSYVNHLSDTLIMTKGVENIRQCFSFDDRFPQKYIKEKQDNGFMVTEFSYGTNQFAVVLSKPTDYKRQDIDSR